MLKPNDSTRHDTEEKTSPNPIGEDDATQVPTSNNVTSGFDETDDLDGSPVTGPEEKPQKSYGRYTIQGTLGSGGFGRVYLAEDADLKRLVALKIPRVSKRSQAMSLQAIKREAQTVAALEIPGVVPIYDIGIEADGTMYIVSKYIRGRDLYTMIQNGSVDRKAGIEICRTVAETLHRVHLESIIHRDIKPGNILIDEEGAPFVADFGLALRSRDFGKTEGITGTLRYMSPEQVRGESHLVDGRSDLFSLGVILYELVTGQRPFDGPDSKTIQHCIEYVEPKPLRQIDDTISPEIERVCLKALSKRASNRYSTGKDLADALTACLTPQSKNTLRRHTDEPVAVVPRGLRAFRGRDSSFFLNLLPGPRDVDGLPDIVRQWKLWIEQRSRDEESRVGVIYGPSGCGKSSIIQAGVLPLVAESVDAAVIQATTDSFDEKVRRALLQYSPPAIDDDVVLTDYSATQLIAHRRDHLGPAGKPLLLVIDQFENWLLNCSADQANEFALTLRQCDGVTTKVLLLVRDDFWTALRRFMTAVDIPLSQDQNCSLVDLFDPSHAQMVLEKFGRAHGRIESDTETTPEQEDFLVRAVEGLTRHGKVYPVQLALFAEMLKGRSWVPKTLQELGGVEGIGTQFLEDAFDAGHAPQKQRIHEPAARRVLESMLPEPGTNVRTRFRTNSEIRQIAGYEENELAFRELIRILNDDLRLVSPTDRFESTSGSASHSAETYEGFTGNEEKSFQLSHDFLIPSVRDWVSQKQLGTYGGRVGAQLNELARLWSAKRARRFVPNWFEWLKFLAFVPKRSQTSEQKALMRFASRKHLINTLIGVACICVCFLVVRGFLQSQHRQSVIGKLDSARFAEIPSISRELRNLGEPAREVVQQQLLTPTLSATRRVGLSMVLSQWESGNARCIIDSLSLRPEKISTVGDFYVKDVPLDSISKKDQQSILNSLWAVLEDDSADKFERVGAAQFLLRFGELTKSENAKRTRAISNQLAKMIVDYAAFDPTSHLALVEAFKPAASQLFRPLASTISIESESPSLESGTAINLLIPMLTSVDNPRPRDLLDVTLEASAWQLQRLVPHLDEHQAEIIPLLETEIASQVVAKQQERKLSKREATRNATSAAILARYDYGNRNGVVDQDFYSLLRKDPYLTLRTALIHRFSDVGAPIESLLKPMAVVPNEDVAAAIMMALGQYDPPAPSPLADRAVNRILQLAEYASTGETMSAANWLLQKWEMTNRLKPLEVDPLNGSDKRNWRVCPGDVIVVTVNGRKVDEIGHVFEISTMEISIQQYQTAFPHNYYQKTVAPTSEHPINVVTLQKAMKYCRWLSEQQGIPENDMCYPPIDEITKDYVPEIDHVERSGYRLPTVAEWQHACRAKCANEFFFGNSGEFLKYYATHAGQRASKCGTLKPNGLGLFDTIGNMQEWTSDMVGDENVLCGGSYLFSRQELSNVTKRTSLPGTLFNSFGFRVARTITNQPKSE